MNPSECGCGLSGKGIEFLTELHDKIMDAAAEGIPPSLDEEEREDAMVQFVVHMRYVLEDIGELLDGAVITCNGFTVVGRGYHRFVSDALVYIRSLVSMLIGVESLPDSEVFSFVMEALSSKVHGFFGNALRSLCAADSFNVSKPVGIQDAATWMVLKSVMSVDQAAARGAVHSLSTRTPNTLAACGFLALLVRSPAASAFLEEGVSKSSGLSTVFSAMSHSTDPYKYRTPLDIVACTQHVNADFAGPGVTQQFHALTRAWMNKRGCDSGSQLFVGQSDLDSRKASLYRLPRCEVRMQTPDWSSMVAEVSRKMDAEKGLTEEESRIWISVWTNCHHIVYMSKRIVARRGCTSAMVAWTYCKNNLYAFARGVRTPTGSIDSWAVKSADEFERDMAFAFKGASLVPSMPFTRIQKRAAIAMPGDHARWDCIPVDKRTTELLDTLRAAQRSEDLCVGQGAFRNGSAFALVSFRMSV